MQASFIRLAATLVALFGMTFAHAEEAIGEAQLPLQELRTFTQVFDQIRRAYVEEIDDKTLLENAIIGMLAELDPHSTYLNQADFDDLHEEAGKHREWRDIISSEPRQQSLFKPPPR